MPITKQVIKRVKQANAKAARNKHYNSHMKSMIKLFLDYVKKEDGGNAEKIMPKVISSIDTCTKKKIIHENNAAHKKSRLSRALNGVKSAPKAKVEKKEEKAEKEAPKAEKAK